MKRFTYMAKLCRCGRELMVVGFATNLYRRGQLLLVEETGVSGENHRRKSLTNFII
jgi:hypothetical protein